MKWFLIQLLVMSYSVQTPVEKAAGPYKDLGACMKAMTEETVAVAKAVTPTAPGVNTQTTVVSLSCVDEQAFRALQKNEMENEWQEQGKTYRE